jgi:response regulator RpfG family c-di-GMP phosphodiesterase
MRLWTKWALVGWMIGFAPLFAGDEPRDCRPDAIARKKIVLLLVNTHPATEDVMLNYLRDVTVHVELRSAYSYEEAWREIHDLGPSLPSLIVTEIRLHGDGTGYDLLRSVRNNPVTQGIPVMFYATAPAKTQSELAISEGANAYFESINGTRMITAAVRELFGLPPWQPPVRTARPSSPPEPKPHGYHPKEPRKQFPDYRPAQHERHLRAQ